MTPRGKKQVTNNALDRMSALVRLKRNSERFLELIVNLYRQAEEHDEQIEHALQEAQKRKLKEL